MSCVKVEVTVLGSPVPNSPYGLCGRTATLNLKEGCRKARLGVCLQLSVLVIQRCFTSTEIIRLIIIGDGEPRTATWTFTQLLSALFWLEETPVARPEALGQPGRSAASYRERKCRPSAPQQQEDTDLRAVTIPPRINFLLQFKANIDLI